MGLSVANTAGQILKQALAEDHWAKEHINYCAQCVESQRDNCVSHARIRNILHINVILYWVNIVSHRRHTLATRTATSKPPTC